MPESRFREQKLKCPRCRSKRVSKRLDGSSFCVRCGQRMSKEGVLLPSKDRRQDAPTPPNQMNLL